MTSVQSPPSSITSVLGEDKKGIALVADVGNVADVVANFQAQLLNPADLSVPVAAIQALTEFIGTSQASTMSEFINEVDSATNALRNHTNFCISVAAGCELFTRFVTRTASESTEDFSTFRTKLVEKIRSFGDRSLRCREKIAELAIDFIQDDAVIMIHSYSRVVMMLLMRAAAMNRRFRVLVTEARPTSRGHLAAETLRKAGVPASVILDAAVGYYIQQVDMILVGAEGVVENGGIINQIGTHLMAVMAKAADIPFYAVAENYKFVRCFPLNQYDLPTMSSALLYNGDGDKNNAAGTNAQLIEHGHPTIDYTPPSYITLLFTDVGVLTPSAVSDELIKLYF